MGVARIVPAILLICSIGSLFADRSVVAAPDLQTEVKNLEKFEANNENLISRNDLPCDDDAKFKLQCSSVRHFVREWRPRSWMKTKIVHKSSKLFDEAYRPQDSKHFDISRSSTFDAHPDKTQDMHYADGTHLRSFTGVDEVYMGDYHAKSPFAVIIDCNSPDFNGVDGILGFGLEKSGSSYPTPILFALTDPNSQASNAQHLQRKFSFFSTDDAAEVQLGGFDPETVTGSMWYTRALSSEDFIVGVTSLKFGYEPKGSVELLQFRTPSSFGAPSILDSGTSCLVLPADSMLGQLKNNPWNDFEKTFAKDKSFWLQIGDRSFKIPPHQWYLSDTDEACVQPAPASMDGLLIGDVFFREYVVEFDMTTKPTTIGIAALNKNYRPVTTSTLTSLFSLSPPDQHPKKVTSLKLKRGNVRKYPSEHAQVLAQVDRIPIVNQQGTQYFMEVGVGTPRQSFTVIFDTGSTVFGVFSYKNKLPQAIRGKLPSSYISQNLHALEQVRADDLGWTWSASAADRLGSAWAAAAFAAPAGSEWSPGAESLLVLVGVLLAIAMAASLRVMGKRRRAHAMESWEKAVEPARHETHPVAVSTPASV